MSMKKRVLGSAHPENTPILFTYVATVRRNALVGALDLLQVIVLNAVTSDGTNHVWRNAHQGPYLTLAAIV
jgi:hypothetical protein